MSFKTKLFLFLLAGLFLTTTSGDIKTGEDSTWTSSYITCANGECVENITFPALNITVDSLP